ENSWCASTGDPKGRRRGRPVSTWRPAVAEWPAVARRGVAVGYARRFRGIQGAVRRTVARGRQPDCGARGPARNGRYNRADYPCARGLAAVTSSGEVNRAHLLRGYGAIAILAVLASFNSLRNGFTYDDRFIIVANPAVRQMQGWEQFFLLPYWPLHQGGDGYR